MPDLEERVTALEARLAPGPLLKPFGLPPLTEEQEAQLKCDFDETMRGPHAYRILPSLPPLTPEQVRCLLSECVTAVKPGEHLILRIPWSTTPSQVRELQDFVTDTAVWLDLPFKVLVLPGDELAVAEHEPEFMADTRVEDFIGTRAQGAVVRLTHQPTSVMVEAPTRPEAVAKLGRALERRAERHATWAGGVPGAAA